MSTQRSTLQNAKDATSSMICGIVGCATSCFIIPGIVLGIIAIKKYKQVKIDIEESGGRLKGRGQSIAGLICGIISIAQSAFFFFYYIIYGFIIGAALKNGNYF
jgi:hypothetical protein